MNNKYYTFYNKAPEDIERQEWKVKNTICEIISCQENAIYILVSKNNDDTKMYCSYHVKELLFNSKLCELFLIEQNKDNKNLSDKDIDERVVGIFEITGFVKR